ncbi:MAG: FtsX-like permease family protein [Alphaproteobacteria bacterium]
MAFAVAWRILTYQKGRTALAVGGIFVAILLIFVELGFFVAVPQGGLLIYDHMRFDLLVTSNRYAYQTESGTFARARLDQVRANPDVAQASAIYIGNAKWQDTQSRDPGGGKRIDATVIGFDPGSGVFSVPDLMAQQQVLERPDTVLVDSQTRAIFGPLDTGRVIDLSGHKVTIGGRYTLGTGFLGLAVVAASEDTFFRIFGTGPRPRPRDTVNLGLVTLKPGADPDKVARALREALPQDTQVLTRNELAANEIAFWTTKTGTGLIFGSGLIVAFIVGIMILYQTLATQITRQLPQFAMLKAIGHTNRRLEAIVLIEAMLVMLAAFLPAVAVSLWVYSAIRAQTLLPVRMSVIELGGVFAVAVVMSAVSAMLSLIRLRRADPAEIF